ncbi:unnamed protein product, partial [Prorocentrum cordatum]
MPLQRAVAVDDAGEATRDGVAPLGRRAAHALACPRSAIRLRAHTGAVRGLEAELHSAAAVVNIERRIPELYQCRPDWSICEAVMDLVFSFPASAQRWLVDANVAGAAAAAQYGDTVRSVA